MHPVATFDQNLKHSTVWIFFPGEPIVVLDQTCGAQGCEGDADLDRQGDHQKNAEVAFPGGDEAVDFFQSMIRVGSDCSGLGTEILALNGIPALTDRVVHVFASEIDVAVAAIFNASHNVNKFYSDVTTRCPHATPVTDIYVNTSPCQPFSMMGSGELFEIDNLPFDFTITCKAGRHKTLLSSLLSALLL